MLTGFCNSVSPQGVKHVSPFLHELAAFIHVLCPIVYRAYFVRAGMRELRLNYVMPIPGFVEKRRGRRAETMGRHYILISHALQSYIYTSL